MAEETPQPSTEPETKPEAKKETSKERAFYCSSSEFRIAKPDKPVIQFHDRFLVTSDENLIAHLLAMKKSLKEAKTPVTILEISLDKVGEEPSSSALAKA